MILLINTQQQKPYAFLSLFYGAHMYTLFRQEGIMLKMPGVMWWSEYLFCIIFITTATTDERKKAYTSLTHKLWLFCSFDKFSRSSSHDGSLMSTEKKTRDKRVSYKASYLPPLTSPATPLLLFCFFFVSPFPVQIITVTAKHW